MKIDYKFIKKYIESKNIVYSVIDIRNLLEEIIDYKEYYPEGLLPEMIKKYKLTIKECKELICICDRKIKEICRVGE